MPPGREPISVVEDLDPEPPQDARRSRVRELILGLALLVGVVVFAGWQWWRQEYQIAQYRAGQEAFGRSAWEEAAAHFDEASGYNDADQRRERAREKIAERDRLYQSALDNSGKGEWLLALKDLRAVDVVQPGYRDISEREKETLHQVYTQALSGTVAMRESASPPGLYLRTETGWAWLKGSSVNSSVVMRTKERVLYVVSEPQSEPSTGADGDGGMEGYKLVIATLKGTAIEYSYATLDLARYSPIIVGEEGIWLGHFNGYRDNERYGGDFLVRRDLFTDDLIYQAYNKPVSATVSLTRTIEFGKGSAVVAVDQHSSRYILAVWENAHGFGADTDTSVYLYLCDAYEGTRRHVYTHRGGGIQSAHISPDGSYLVVHTYARVDRPYKERQSMALVEIAREGLTTILADEIVDRTPLQGWSTWMSSLFLREGRYAGHILLAEYQRDHTHIRLVDPARASGTGIEAGIVFDSSVAGTVNLQWRLAHSGQEGLVLVGDAAFSPGGGDDLFTSFTIFAISPELTARQFDVRGGPNSYLMAMQPWRDLFVYTFLDYGDDHPPPNSSTTWSARTISRTSERTDPIEADILVATSPAGSFSLGPSLLAYSDGNRLKVHSYRGDVEEVLESGVSDLRGPVDSTAWEMLLR